MPHHSVAIASYLRPNSCVLNLPVGHSDPPADPLFVTTVAIGDVAFVNDECASICCFAAVQHFGSNHDAILVTNNSDLSLNYLRCCHCAVLLNLLVLPVDGETHFDVGLNLRSVIVPLIVACSMCLVLLVG